MVLEFCFSRTRAARALAWAVGACTLPLSLLALDPAKSLYQYNCQNWSRQNGLRADQINTLAQTNDGYIWLGTSQGLERFDGLEFQSVPAIFPGAKGEEVRKLQAARNGALWITINHGGFGGYDGRTFFSVDHPSWPRHGMTGKTMLETRDGAVWTGSNLGLGRWVKGAANQGWFDTTAERVISLCEAPSGRVWIGTEERGLFYRDHGKVLPAADASLRDEIIFSLAVTPEGDVWVGTARELRRYDEQGRRKSIPAIRGVRALMVDRHGVLWIGCESGLVRYSNDTFSSLHKTDGLVSDLVSTLMEDSEGSLWIGTQEGLSELTDVRFPIYSAREGIAAGAAHTVSASHKGGLWITTSRGISHFDGNTPHNYTTPLLPDPYVKLGFEAKNGDFYFVGGDRTIGVLSGGVLAARYPSTLWPEALAEDNESVLVGLGLKLVRIRDGRFEPYRFKPGREADFGYISNLCVAHDGAIWVASYHGVFRIKDGDFQQWTTTEGLSGERVYSIFQDSDDAVWAALPTGIARFKEGRFANITTEQGLPDDRVYAIVPDNRGYFWIDSKPGFLRVTRQSLNDLADKKIARIACETFEGLESVKSVERTDQEYSGCKTADGRIWFPTSRGVAMIDPSNVAVNRMPPPVHIHQIKVDGIILQNRQQSMLEVGNERVEFFFSALSYISPRKVQIRYRLEGFDSEWNMAGARRSVLYRLKPGKYRFRVEAANADGIWNRTGDIADLELPPHFYQTWWFYSFCGLATASTLAGGFRWKVRKMRRLQRRLRAENDLLEQKVSARTDELASSLSVLRGTLESTADGVLAIHFSGKVGSYNRQFTTMWGIAPEVMATADDTMVRQLTATQVRDPERFLQRIAEMHQSTNEEAFDVIELKDGRVFERYCKPQLIEGKTVGFVINFRDVTARKLAEAKLAEVHRQLLETSRQAGMAEVATGVLHNVGNVLNSVNVSASLIHDQVRQSKFTNVARVAALVRAHEDDLAAFLTADPKGRRLPDYLSSLADELAAEQKQVGEELDHLVKNIEHIKDIVAMQQNYAKVSGVVETLPIVDLVEDALRMNASALVRHSLEIVRDFQANPPVTVQRHKVLQILINLIRNAKYACDDSGRTDKRLTLQIYQEADRVKVGVIDNGIGIPAENLIRIFAHGFTTRKDGHGFGLHSGALAARELDGSLTAYSDGQGLGARFVLDLPVAP